MNRRDLRMDSDEGRRTARRVASGQASAVVDMSPCCLSCETPAGDVKIAGGTGQRGNP